MQKSQNWWHQTKYSQTKNLRLQKVNNPACVMQAGNNALPFNGQIFDAWQFVTTINSLQFTGN